MKKIIFCLTTFLIGAGAAFCQVAPSFNKGGFFVKGGLNFANISTTADGRIDRANTLTTFNVGMGVDVPIVENLSFQAFLMVNSKGAKTEVGQTTDPSYFRASSNPIYVELPANFVGKIKLSDDARLFMGGGGYAAIGVAGKNETEGKVFNVSFIGKNDIVFDDGSLANTPENNAGYSKLKRFDIGLNALAGIEFNKFNLGVNYGHGLVKINANTNNNSNDRGKHRVWSIFMGLRLF